MVEKRVLEVGDGDAVSSEEPLFELLNEGCFERCDILVQLNDFVPERFDFFELEFVVPLAELLLLDEFELLLVDDVLGKLLLSLVLLFLVDAGVDFLEGLFFALDLLSLYANAFFLLFEVLDVFQDACIQLLSGG